MAPPVPKRLRVLCPENEALSRFFLEKWRSMMKEPGGLAEHQCVAFSNAKRSISAADEPIRTLDGFKNTKGVGPWLTFHMKEFFADPSLDFSPAEADVAGRNGHQFHGTGKKTSVPKSYLPKKNSAAYAILITLLRAKIRGQTFMLKQELINAAEASGLSRDGIGPNKSKAKQSYGKDWYTGWSCMKTLLSKKLVERTTGPLKYMLTEIGEDTARDCLTRPGVGDSAGPLVIASAHNTSAASHNSDHLCMGPSVAETMSGPFMTIRRSRTGVARHSPKLVCDSSPKKMQSSYNAHVQTNYCAQGIIICDSDSDSDSEELHRKDSPLKVFPVDSYTSFAGKGPSAESTMLHKDTACMGNDILAMPPRQSNEKFLEAYEVVLILDDREKFGRGSRKVADNIRSQIRVDVPVEVKYLPVGDGIWIARHKKHHADYVLDYIVERKNVSDLDDSIKDNRYRDQKLKLKRCGLRKLIYLVEGDLKSPDVRERDKTAGPLDMLILRGYMSNLTHSIVEYYDTNFSKLANTSRICPTFGEFEQRCNDAEKKTVSQIFALQLMQVPQVTKEAASAVIELYPTLFSLARAYLMLDGDTRAQEEMLQNKSNKVNAGASRNIFKLVWADGGDPQI